MEIERAALVLEIGGSSVTFEISFNHVGEVEFKLQGEWE